ncbi:ParB/RepB/Spo0J family partition protein [Streptomyces puniciscabiei]
MPPSRSWSATTRAPHPKNPLESALVANIHRQDLEELDEARALRRLLAIHGSQRALAKRLHRSRGWISQRLALLNLAPELRARIGEEPTCCAQSATSLLTSRKQPWKSSKRNERARKRRHARRSPAPRSQRQPMLPRTALKAAAPVITA